MSKTETLESKWQKKWADGKAFQAESQSSKPKYYALDMFPYPSGSGLHVGHMASYMPADVISRYKRTRGFNVLHPMGWDAFGLPAEQYAIQTGIHPAITTDKAIESFRSTLQSFGFSFDWSREISTCDPDYYKWTQFIFTKLWEKGLAYQKEVPVNWCPALRTVLANEEVVDGKSERGGHPVIRQPMKQWMLKITDYAERLLNDLDKIDWPERTKEGQRNWIGKSEGAHVRFKLKDHADELEVFTTRPDTLFGVTFMVLAPENPLVAKITTAAQKAAVDDYVLKTSRKLEIDRKASTEKTGVATGAFALHPFTQEPIPVWIADYVLMDYGTGAIMAVPGHDQRDFDFAKAFSLPIKRVLAATAEEASAPLETAFEDDGILVNSDFLNGSSKGAAISKAIERLEKEKIGRKEVLYKLRDWLFSRQRYWGEPFPMVNFPKQGLQALPVNELPVVLPQVADYEPSEKGEAPLARNADWVRYSSGGEEGRRETDTMPGSAGSSWYFLRFIDPRNHEAPFSPEAEKYWMPVDLYVGGPEHTVGHLLYSRFWTKVLFDVGLVSHDEPFQKLAHQGMILGPDGEKMSKSRGNVIPADSIRSEAGADAVRTFICFLGPMDKDKPWSPTGIEGIRRFLDRVSRLVMDDENGQNLTDDKPLPDEVLRLLHKTIKKVTDDIESMSFNTAISAMMILVNELIRTGTHSRQALKPLTQLLMPFAPHLAEELWEKMGGTGFVSLAPWPQYDNSLLADEKVTLGVQVNGKMRGTIQIAPDAPEADAVQAAQSEAGIASHLSGKEIAKVIYKAGKILNLIVK
ncbi:MAG: leucine--tRNA ligase [Bdellovibrionaceae bacterium]|nr:leucine--tRNA ligase [Pseudobdellovibrionaceae bacterium]